MDPPDYLLPNDQLTGQKVELIKGEKKILFGFFEKKNRFA